MMPQGRVAWKNLARRWVPIVLAIVLVGYFLSSTDLPHMRDAIMRADWRRLALITAGATVFGWLYDSACLTWLVRVTLGHRGKPEPVSLASILPLKASSYLLNILNYHAAALGMAWLIGRRKGVPYLEAAGALAVLSYIDLIAVTAMAVVGILVSPEFFGPYPALQIWLQTVAVGVFGGALATALLLQSRLSHPLLERLRALAPLRPLAALGPGDMLVGVVLRVGFILFYATAAYLQMGTFGMTPQWGRIFVALPILTVVGTIPISVSGYGSTQVLMRSFYAPFVPAGQSAVAVVDAFSTLYITGYMVFRLVLAAPYFRAIASELRQRPPEAE